MKKVVSVSVDLFEQGIFDFPITYGLKTDKDKPGITIVYFTINLDKDNLPEWLYSKSFEYSVSRNKNDDAAIISICRSGEKMNIYNELMLNVISEYIGLKEFTMKQKL
ncbi:hypothetical protein [Pedobacter mucosus]|uniref:hypothetical protein n=1 Tax=Pedobacter mucosus TaxID=2895286 RepID=UPI001EE3A8D6|nr:hypothetical protein [Pedobacter mucosus]UKT65888.1 hypothetical protein LOK61_08865 [Pedobacter mucosus]